MKVKTKLNLRSDKVVLSADFPIDLVINGIDQIPYVRLKQSSYSH